MFFGVTVTQGFTPPTHGSPRGYPLGRGDAGRGYSNIFPPGGARAFIYQYSMDEKQPQVLRLRCAPLRKTDLWSVEVSQVSKSGPGAPIYELGRSLVFLLPGEEFVAGGGGEEGYGGGGGLEGAVVAVDGFGAFYFGIEQSLLGFAEDYYRGTAAAGSDAETGGETDGLVGYAEGRAEDVVTEALG